MFKSERFMFSSAPLQFHYYLTVITLLDQLDPKEYKWEWVSVILQNLFPLVSKKLVNLICEMSANFAEFSRVVSKFLMDRERAGFLWVNSQNYADLAKYILDFLCNK